MLYLIEPEVAGGHGEFTEYEVREEGQWELYTKVGVVETTHLN